MSFGFRFGYGYSSSTEERVPSAPTAMTITASDDEAGQVTITRSGGIGYPFPTYTITRDVTELTTTASFPYVDTIAAGTYTYEVVATNSEGTSTDTDDGTSLVAISADSITQNTAGSCEYLAGGDCEATSSHTVNVSNEQGTVAYVWTLVGDATIEAGQGTDTVTVSTDGNTGVTFDLTCTVADDWSGDDVEARVVHSRSEATINFTASPDPLVITYDSTPALVVPSAVTSLVATSDEVGRITLTWDDSTGYPTPTYKVYRDDTWLENVSVSDYVDTIAAGTYTYRIDATNSEGTATGTEDDGTSQAGDVPISADSISEDSAGSCDYHTAGTCVATSTHTITVSGDTGTVAYSWSTNNGAVIASGQGTDTVTVTTDSGGDVTFALNCNISDDNSSDSLAVDFTHSRTELTVPTAVDDLSGTESDTEVVLTWTAPANGGSAITGYDVYVDTVFYENVAGLTSTVDSLTNDVAYDFTVKAVNAVGDSLVSNTYVGTPTAASSLTAYSHFEFNDDLVDTMGNSTASDESQIIYVDNKLDFDTSAGYFRPNVDCTATTPYSMAIKLTDSSDAKIIITQTKSQGALYMGASDNKFCFQSQVGNYAQTCIAEAARDTAVEYVVVVTVANLVDRPKMYIEGVLQTPAQASWWKDADIGVDIVGCGYYPSDYTARAHVIIDDLAYYDKELSQAEVTEVTNLLNGV